MNCLTLACVLALAVCALAGNEYTNKFDNVDLNEIMSNRRMLQTYIKCVLDQGKCSSEGKELKSHIKEALENNCAKCNPKQKEGARRVLTHLINNEPEWWAQLVDKYDHERKFTHKYEKELRQIKG